MKLFRKTLAYVYLLMVCTLYLNAQTFKLPVAGSCIWSVNPYDLNWKLIGGSGVTNIRTVGHAYNG